MLQANDADSLSNTFFLDRCVGWSGICVEPQRKYHEALLSKRTCDIVPTCASDAVRSAEFFNADVLGGIVSTNHHVQSAMNASKHAPAGDKLARKKAALLTRGHATETLKCVPLQTVLARRALQHIDVMSLDVEGHELEVLQGINWNRTQIDLLIVEKNPRKDIIGAFLQSKGYTNRQDVHPEFWMSKGMRWGERESGQVCG